MYNIFSQKKEIVKNDMICELKKEKIYNYVINWDCSEKTRIFLFNYLINDKQNFSFKLDNKCDVLSNSYKVKYGNIQYIYNECIFKFSDIEFEFMNNKIISYNKKYIESDFDLGTEENPTCLTTFVKHEKYKQKLMSYIKMINSELEKKEYESGTMYNVPFISHSDSKKKNAYPLSKKMFDKNIFLSIYASQELAYSYSWPFEFVITFLLKIKYPNINIQITILELFLFNNNYICKKCDDFHTLFKKSIFKKLKIEKIGIDIDLPEYTKYDLHP
jgi:hypothetical protein